MECARKPVTFQAQDPYPRPRRPQIGPDCSPARTLPPQPEFNPGRIVSTPSPAEPCINLPARTPSPQKPASFPALPRPDGEDSPPLKGTPPLKEKTPAGKLCRHPCREETFYSRPFTLRLQKVSPRPHVTTCQRPRKRKQPCRSLLMAAENSPSTPCSPLANTKPNTAVIIFPPFPICPALSRVPQKVAPLISPAVPSRLRAHRNAVRLTPASTGRTSHNAALCVRSGHKAAAPRQPCSLLCPLFP